MSDSVQTRLPRPWESPGKNTGVGCHFLLQCMKVKSESEVAQSCATPSDPMDCSLPGCSVHGIFQAKVPESGAIVCKYFKVLWASFLYCLCCCLVSKSCLILFDTSPPGSFVEWVAISYSKGYSRLRLELMSPAWQADSLSPRYQGSDSLKFLSDEGKIIEYSQKICQVLKY